MRKQVKLIEKGAHGYAAELSREAKDLAAGYHAKRLLKRVRS